MGRGLTARLIAEVSHALRTVGPTPRGEPVARYVADTYGLPPDVMVSCLVGAAELVNVCDATQDYRQPDSWLNLAKDVGRLLPT